MAITLLQSRDVVQSAADAEAAAPAEAAEAVKARQVCLRAAFRCVANRG